MTARSRQLIRSAYGATAAEAFLIIAIITILATRSYLHLTGYPQIGGGNLHIAHALWGGALMMTSLIIGWLFIGFGVRATAVVLGGIGLGLFLDEVGKFVTKDNDYFYGPSAEIMYILVAGVLVLNRIIRDLRPPSAREFLANAAEIAAQGIVQGMPQARREWAHGLAQAAEDAGADPASVAHVRGLIDLCGPGDGKLASLKNTAIGWIPAWTRSHRWIPVVGWLMVLTAGLGVAFGAIGAALGGYFYEDRRVHFELAGMSVATALLLLSATITLALSLPAMIALRRTDKVWPLELLQAAALSFTTLNALVEFATDGFAAVGNLMIGLAAVGIITYQVRQRRELAAGEVVVNQSASARM
ncbi:MAG: hypothetical protein LLG14_18580 [Nocardiaceae bacterium]|nr:hypothetical protein [Nocardiaceae bacterium]